MIETSNADRYLAAVVAEFEREAQEYTGFDLRKRLWHACVVVCEVTADYEQWHPKLASIAFHAGVSARDIPKTIESAKRRAGVA